VPPDVLQDQYARLRADLVVLQNERQTVQARLQEVNDRIAAKQSDLQALRDAYQAWKGTTP
jgi:predicted  nucleic acid-binding Zn-ribbon protein